jgi:hypothetical protein
MEQIEQQIPPIEWIHVSDDMINNIGYAKTKSNKSSHRSNLSRFIKKRYKHNIEYKTTRVKSTKGGAHHKHEIYMTQIAYNDLLQKTNDLRTKPKHVKTHFIYVMHNPMYLHYGCNVYKVGYSENVDRRVTDYATGYVEESEIVYSKQVASRDCEMQVHKLMDSYRINSSREFFNCPLDRIIQFIETLPC